MPDADKILEAEQSIQNIAEELKKMRNAASLLQDAQERTEALLNASERVIKVTEEFSLACGEIVGKLATIDLNQRLDNIHGVTNHIGDLISDHAKKTSDDFATTEAKLAGLMNVLEEFKKGSKKRHTIYMVLITSTLVTAIAALVSTLLRAIGG